MCEYECVVNIITLQTIYSPHCYYMTADSPDTSASLQCNSQILMHAAFVVVQYTIETEIRRINVSYSNCKCVFLYFDAHTFVARHCGLYM